MSVKIGKKPEAASLNIQSFIRVRPLFAKEKKAQNLELTKKDVIIKGSESCRASSKKLIFDRVFDEEVKQVAVYSTVVRPMIKEVLQGYNCTVFAYGQTGTGKTYTMSGELGEDCKDNIHAGIIPRAMDEIFKELAEQPCEYQVTISYMELYNEKLRSLLCTVGEETDIKLIDDMEGGVILKGLAVTPVKSKEEAFMLLQQGTEKRQTAATLMNMNSSRSHTIFTISVNIKESNPVNEKDDVLRIGKLHLVDLAGSENVSKSGTSDTSNKSGAMSKRLTEASNINKSLLTLGRVITCITENNTHIPYRESKLTRFLRDSLGGRTKTCIIGTISPAQANIDETESTLNYAYKAKSIKNKPEKNLTISKKEFMQVASEEIMKLKRDLEAVRQGDGFFISKETHEDMNTNMKSLSNQVHDWNERYNRLKETYDENKELFTLLSSDFDDKCAEYEELQRIYQSDCEKFKEGLGEITKHILVREYLINEYMKTESVLTKEANKCKTVLETIFEHNHQLHDKIDRKRSMESANVKTLSDLKTKTHTKIVACRDNVLKFINAEEEFTDEAILFTKKTLDSLTEHYDCIRRVINQFQETTEKNSNLLNEAETSLTCEIESELKSLQSVLSVGLLNERNSLNNIVQCIIAQVRKPMCLALGKIQRDLREHIDEFKLAEQSQINYKQTLLRQQELLEFSVKEVVKEFEAVEKEISLAMQEAMLMKKNAMEAQEKAQEICTIAGKLKESIDNVTDSADSVENSVKSVALNVASLKNTSELQHTDNITEINQQAKEYFEEQDRFVFSFPRTISQIDAGAEELLKLHNYSLERVKEVCDQMKTNEVNRRNIEKDSFENLTDIVKASVTEFQTKLKEWTNDAQGQCLNIRRIIDDKENTTEVVLREKHLYITNHRGQYKEKEGEICSKLEEVANDLSLAKYKEYSPQGNTPPRVATVDLEYPHNFSSSRPRDIYFEQFKDYADCDLQSDSDWKRHIPAKLVTTIMDPDGSLKHPVSPLPEELQAQDVTPLKFPLRRSVSAPDVKSPDSQVEDKENSFIMSYNKGNSPSKTRNSRHLKRKIFSNALSQVNRSLPPTLPTKGFK